MAPRHRFVDVVGREGYTYTNPGGHVRRDGKELVLARRTRGDMSTEVSRGSDIVLLMRRGARTLVDEDVVLLHGDAERRISYEDPRLLMDGSGYTYTFVNGDLYCSWYMPLEGRLRARFSRPVGPRIVPSKNGYLFRALDGSCIVVLRPDLLGRIEFYRLDSQQQALDAFAAERDDAWWRYRLVGIMRVPSWMRGERGEFGHIGFGTMLLPSVAVIHLARSTDKGKYYVTALHRVSPRGEPEGAPEIVTEPAPLDPGHVPGVIYTQMAWLEGRTLIMWSGHDDSRIVETKVRAPRWVLERSRW